MRSRGLDGRAEHLVDVDLIAVGQAVRLVGHADDRHQLAQHRLGHAAGAGRCGVRRDAVVAAVGGADGEIDHLLRQRIQHARRHHRLERFPRAPERGRMTRERFPEVVDPVGLARGHDVVVDRAYLTARLRVLDHLHGCHDASCSVHGTTRLRRPGATRLRGLATRVSGGFTHSPCMARSANVSATTPASSTGRTAMRALTIATTLLLIATGVAPALAQTGTWISHGPEGGSIPATAVDPRAPNTVS